MVQVWLFLAGIALLVVGAEALVRGASRLALAAGLSPLVIGLTVVAFGTSAPELTVSVVSALSGRGDVAFGNVVGSNTFNVLFILGLSAAITPLAVDAKLVRIDVPLVIAASFAMALLALDGTIGRIDGLLLAGGLVVYTVFAIRVSRRENREIAARDEAARPGGRALAAAAAIAGAGLAMLVLGSDILVDAAVAFARALGLSDLIIGLTIVAAGTSLPEVATSVLAAIRGQRDIAVGNVVGSNLFNILGVLGVASVVSPDGIRVPPEAMAFDVPVMLAVAIACLPIVFTGRRIDRWEGVLLLAYYAAYTAFLVLDATGHDSLPAFSFLMAAFVLPLTVVTLGVLVWRAIPARSNDGR